MKNSRQLIVNADDFGQSPGINQGIIQAHEHGIVTSASLLVRWPAAPQAAAYARTNSRLSVGLHVDLGEWTCRDGVWTPLYQVVISDDPGAVETEVLRQLELFRRLLGRDPTHLDSHQHVHRREPVRGIVEKLAANLHVPLRDGSSVVRYEGGFYGQFGTGQSYREGIGVAALCSLLRPLPAGITELSCHPAALPDMDALYRDERIEETHTLCDQRIQAFLLEHSIELRSFHGLRNEEPAC